MSDMLTIRDAAKYLSVHPITLYRMLKKGELPEAFKVGRVWHIAREDLERFTIERSLATKPQ